MSTTTAPTDPIPPTAPAASHDAATSASTAEPADSAAAPACECTPAAPAGWNGPYAVALGTDDVSPCVKDGGYEVEAYLGRSGVSARDPECKCTCGKPDTTCSIPVTSTFADGVCLGPCRTATDALSCGTPLTCGEPSAKALGVRFGESTPLDGSCAPKLTAYVPPLASDRSIRLCAPRAAAGTCDGGVCLPVPTSPFSKTNRCVTKSGTVESCPATFPVRSVFRSAGTDTRGCSACSCAAPEGVKCRATASISSSACKDPTVIDVPSGCTPIAGSARIVTVPGTPEGGSCKARGGEPIGAFAAGPTTTVCCRE